MSYITQTKIQFTDTAVRDAFGNLRTVTPYTVFNNKQIADKNPLLFDESIVGVGASSTYQTNKACTLMTVPSNTVSSVIRQSKRWLNYQSGKSQKITMTLVFGTGGIGIIKRAGLFEAKNGVFFALNNSVLAVGLRSFVTGSVVDTIINQADWNIDKLDGTGASGATIDITKTQIIVIDFQWLGAGRVRFGFSLSGCVYYCHEICNANINTNVYMGTPNLPIRYEIINGGTGGTNSLTAICSAVESEGGEQDLGITRVLTRGITPLVTNNDSNLYPLLAFRLRSGYLHTNVDVVKCSIACISTATFEYQLIVNPIITGTQLSYTTMTNSGIEYDVSRTNSTTVSGGDLILDAGLDSAGTVVQSTQSSFRPGSKIDGTSDIIVLAVRRITGTSETFYANMVINEVV